MKVSSMAREALHTLKGKGSQTLRETKFPIALSALFTNWEAQLEGERSKEKF